jgi:hypothetical protein
VCVTGNGEREREGIAGERDDRWGLAVGEREGGKAGLGWFRGELGRLALLCIFSFCFLFLLFLIFVLGFEKAILFWFE